MNCKQCGRDFQPSKNDARIEYCSVACRLEHRKQTDYMRRYYNENKGGWKMRQRTREYRDEKNAARRAKYAQDAEYRERQKKLVREYNERNPETKLNQRMRKFGITWAVYQQMYANQDGKCAICGMPIGDEMGNRLYVDHNHTTGKVRGLLCSSCNFGIGKFRDDAALLKAAAQYLEENDGERVDMV